MLRVLPSLLLPLALVILVAFAQPAYAQRTTIIHTDQLFSSNAKALPRLASDQQRLQLHPEEARRLLGSAVDLQLVGFPVGAAATGNLLLHRRRSAVDATTQCVVATQHGDSVVRGPAIDFFTGEISGVAGSKVWLVWMGQTEQMFAIIEHADGRAFILGPSLEQGAASTDHLMAATTSIHGRGMEDFVCNTRDDVEFLPKTPPPPMSAQELATKKLLELELALETDSEFFTATGGSVEKTQAYAAALYAAVSSIYEDELHVTIHLSWLKTWTDSPRDPYDVKGDGYALADKVRPYWKANYAAVKRDVFQVATSINYGGGGFGYYNALCNGAGDNSFSVYSVQGSNALPTFAFSYDVYIAAHELGHNFNAPHTHNCYWGAPIDTCIVTEGIQGGCLPQDAVVKPNPGSIMSYCGGANSAAGLGYTLRMTFLPQVAALMRQTAEGAACLTEPLDGRIVLVSPRGQEVFDAGGTSVVRWRSAGVTSVSLDYSSDDGVTWMSIAKDLPAESESYGWAIPQFCSKRTRVRAVSSSNASVADTSLLPFSVRMTDPTGLVAYYPFNGNALDEALCGYYPAAGNATPTTNRFGRPNSAFAFSGGSGLTAPDFGADFSAITVSCWFKLTTGSEVQLLVGQDPAAGVTFQMFSWNGVLGGALWYDGGGAPFQIWGPTLSLNEWHNAVLVYDGTTVKLRLDNVTADSLAKSGTLAHSLSALYIGALNGWNTSGAIDDIRIYRRALSNAELDVLFKEGGSQLSAPEFVAPSGGAMDLSER